jgi:hypothetical protein
MFERHIYNKPFFRFLLEMVDYVELPFVSQEDLVRGYRIEGEPLSADQKDEVLDLIKILKKFTLDVVARAMENQVTDSIF